MALVRLGDIAVDWNSIYLIALNNKNEIEIHFDVPPDQQPPLKIEHGEMSLRIWDRARDDERLEVFDGFAMDISLLRVVALAQDGPFLLFALPSGRFAKIICPSGDVITAIFGRFENPGDGERVEPIDK